MLTIRSTTAADLADVVALEAELDTAIWLAETGRAWHEQVLADPDAEHVLAEDVAGLVGFAVLAGLREGDGLVELRRMAVERNRRGHGLGRAVLRVAVERAYTHHGARSVWLDVKAHNHRAIALYRSAGFAPSPGARGALTEPDGTVTELVVMVHEPR